MDIHNEGLLEKFIKRGAWLYFFSFLIGPIGYAIKITVSYDLSVSDVGMLYGILSFVYLVASFNDFGMIESLNYFIPKLLAKNETAKAKSFVTYGAIAMLVSSFAVGSILLLGAHWLADNYFKIPEAGGLIQLFVIYLMFSNVLHFNVTIFSIYQNTKQQKFSEFIRMALTLCFAVSLHMRGLGTLETYSWAWNYGMMLAVAISSYGAWRYYLMPLIQDPAKITFEKAYFKELFSYGLWSLLTMNIGIILSQIDMQLLILMKGTEDAGLYSNYLSLIGIPFVFTSPIIAFIFPVVSSYVGRGEHDKLTSIRMMFTRLFSVIGVIGTLVFFLYGSDLGVFFFGEKFRASGDILLYSAPFLIFNLLLQINFQILGGTGRVRKRLSIMLVGLAVNFALNLVLIPSFGPQGSALAVGLSWIPIWILSSRATQEYAGTFDWKFFTKNILAASAIAAVIYEFFPRTTAGGNLIFAVSLGAASLCFL
ncbi:MAG: polysaccharide biosynthesis C-terminal domain-containing protein [Patescibacteria group bacterium]